MPHVFICGGALNSKVISTNRVSDRSAILHSWQVDGASTLEIMCAASHMILTVQRMTDKLNYEEVLNTVKLLSLHVPAH